MTDPHHARDDEDLKEPDEALGLGLRARAIVDRIIDGDTMVVSLRLPVHVRLRDCWAPEIRGADKENGHRSRDQLSKMAPVGAKVILDIDTSDADVLGDILTFGRVVGHVFRPGDVESLSEHMVATGFATKERS